MSAAELFEVPEFPDQYFVNMTADEDLFVGIL